jgi:hypothetical protein
MLEGNALTPPPSNVRRLTFVGAELPPSRPDGHQWDEDGPPDLFVVLYRNGEELYRTPVVRDSPRPEWSNAAMSVFLDPQQRFRVELRDDDGSLSELVSDIEFTGIPAGASEGGNVTLRMDGGSVVRLRSTNPPPMLGLGLTYEIHETYARVLAIEEASPARRAGVQHNDKIVSVDGRTVQQMGEVGTRQALDRGSLRDVSLTLQRENRPMFVVDVRLDALYPAR